MNVNYPELGSPGATGRMYNEGDEMTHPSGAIYKRINGNWVFQRAISTKEQS